MNDIGQDILADLERLLHAPESATATEIDEIRANVLLLIEEREVLAAVYGLLLEIAARPQEETADGAASPAAATTARREPHTRKAAVSAN